MPLGFMYLYISLNIWLVKNTPYIQWKQSDWYESLINSYRLIIQLNYNISGQTEIILEYFGKWG